MKPKIEEKFWGVKMCDNDMIFYENQKNIE